MTRLLSPARADRDRPPARNVPSLPTIEHAGRRRMPSPAHHPPESTAQNAPPSSMAAPARASNRAIDACLVRLVVAEAHYFAYIAHRFLRQLARLVATVGDNGTHQRWII